jgi:choline dehydrogenase-like flavoprotein
MSQAEHFDIVILGSGQGGKQLAWHLGRSGKKVAVVERRWVAAPARQSPVSHPRMNFGVRGSPTSSGTLRSSGH